MNSGVEQWKWMSHRVFTGMVADGLPREGPCFRGCGLRSGKAAEKKRARQDSESSFAEKIEGCKTWYEDEAGKMRIGQQRDLDLQKNVALGGGGKVRMYTLRACWPMLCWSARGGGKMDWYSCEEEGLALLQLCCYMGLQLEAQRIESVARQVAF